jgi:outer membrane cobalamin receptor
MPRPLALRKLAAIGLLLFSASIVRATVFSQLQGVVHDPQHRPLAAAHITLAAVRSAFTISADTNSEGSFTLPNIPLGDYTVTVTHPGFATLQQSLTLHSNTTPILHFQLQLASVSQTVNVTAEAQTASVDTVTPTALLSRTDIAQTPGADRTNSMAMITDYVPGAYMTHDMLHMRGGHQVEWLIDGVEIPNTNIASNLAAQIDPKDIDYLEVQRGSYTADVGDRTYGVFNVVPRTGFERDRSAELVLSAGNFLQTNDQLSLGDHSERSAYYVSLNANRSDYGLAPPIGAVHHDVTNGFGGFASLLYNRTPQDQLRLIGQLRQDFFQIPSDPSTTDFEAQQYNSSGLRDTQHERDSALLFSWIKTLNPETVLQISPLFHSNSANYDSASADTPVATTVHRASTYAGAQASLTTTIARNTLQAGIYSFGQHDSTLFAVLFNDGTGTAPIHEPDAINGGVVEEYLSDSYKPTAWLTLDAGLRQAHFQSQLTENATDPRVGAALRIPRLNWVFRSFYGRFYQPPPLVTASGPVLAYANANSATLVPLHGERDEEHQFGLQIPYRGWLLDADTFKTRVNNFLDHSNIGDSSIYLPITVDGALVRAWELALRSPRIAHLGQAHLAYSNQIAEQRGNITGGLICTPIGDPACDAGFTYTPVDHDQRNTLNVGFNATLPAHAYASANVYFGSGFHNGAPDSSTPYPNQYLPYNTTFDLAFGKSITEKISASITATNLANRRVLLDNSLTFGGFHFNDPRQLYAELRYRFHF